MYEIWVNQENPARHLVIKAGSAFPQKSETVNWSRLGTGKVVESVAAAVERDGSAEVMAVTPFDAAVPFGPGDVSGTQQQIPG